MADTTTNDDDDDARSVFFKLELFTYFLVSQEPTLVAVDGEVRRFLVAPLARESVVDLNGAGKKKRRFFFFPFFPSFRNDDW